MVKAIARLALAGSIILASASQAPAHHSAAAYDTAKEVRVTGTVLQYRFANPHVYLTLQVKNADGSTTRLEIEAGAASVLNGLGFTKDSVAVGDVVTVVGNPDRKNAGFVLGRDLYKRDGSYVPLNIASHSVYQEKTDTATSIAGTWFAPRSEFTAYMGGTSRWNLTEKGRAAASAVIYSGVVEDPVYLTQPAQWSGKWEYRPTMRHSNQKCDIEIARRFLQQ